MGDFVVEFHAFLVLPLLFSDAAAHRAWQRGLYCSLVSHLAWTFGTRPSKRACANRGKGSRDDDIIRLVPKLD